MTSGAAGLSVPLLRLLGGDPEVFFPVAKAHELLARRRAGIVRRGGALAQISPFRVLCLFALLYGVFGVLFVVAAQVGILGEAIAVAVACMFLLMVVVTDHLDLLVNPREQLVLGAHPHDDRSILLAKLWVVGRTLGILFALLSVPATIAVGVREGALAGLLFLGGAAAAGLTAAMFGLYLGVAILALFGRRGFERLMPWLQVAFQLSYFLFFGGERLMRALGSQSPPAWLAWAFPPLWFLAPLQATQEGRLDAEIAGRAALAVLVLAGLAVGGTRWLGSRVGDRLLEPVERARRPSSRAAPRPRPVRARPTRRRSIGGAERSRLFDLLRVHLRVDWKSRSEFFMGPLVCGFLFATSSRQWSSWMAFGFIGWFLLLSMDVLTRSPRPELLWFILVSPMDRARFSRSSVSLMRALQLLPLLAIFVVFMWKSSGPELADRLLLVALLAAYGDLLIVLGRGLFPEFPFSRAARANSPGARRMVLLLLGGLISGAATAALYVLGRQGRAGIAAGIVLLILAHLPAAWWMTRRVAAAAEGLELEAGSVA